MTDLRSRLHDVVDGPETAGEPPAGRGATALDDVLVGTLTARVRRRRAVRTGVTGALGALTVATVAVGATALTDDDRATPPPAGTEQPPPDGVAAPPLRCGDAVPLGTLHAEREGLTLAAPELANPTVIPGEKVEVTVGLAYDGTTPLDWDTEQRLELAVLQDGVVVATAVMPFVEAMPAGVYTYEEPVTLSACTPTGRLAAGGYDLIAYVVLANADGSDAIELASGPVPVTVVAEVDEATRLAEAEAALAEVVAAAESARADAAVGACGTRIPVTADPYVGLDIEVSPYAGAGEPLDGTGTLAAHDGLTVVGDAPIAGVQVVLTRDGVVVGYGGYDDTFVSRLTIGGEPLELPAVGDADLCRLPGADGPTLPLPAGSYQAYGLYRVAVADVDAVGDALPGEGDVVTGTRTVVSEPVDVVVSSELG